jgi:elongation factor P hydroxylase
LPLYFSVKVLSMHHRYQDLIDIFHQTFYHQYQTRLVKGDGEPVYLPSDEKNPDHRIVFAHGFYASALHEASHWLVAGTQRRLLEDFGYWYNPDGRTAKQQKVFELVEVKPQSIEWALSVAAGFEFKVSCDNLDGEQSDHVAFQRLVYQQVAYFMEKGFPRRVAELMKGLSGFYQTELPTSMAAFHFDGIEQQELQCA